MIQDYIKSKRLMSDDRAHHHTVKNGDLELSGEKSRFDESPQITVKK